MASARSRTTDITGSTTLFAIVGDPVDQVKAPAALNPVFAELGMNAVMIPMHASSENFAEIIRGLKLIPEAPTSCGAMVTAFGTRKTCAGP